MRDALVVNLEEQVKELQERLQQAEQDGAEIAQRFDAEVIKANWQKELLREELNPVYCRRCETKRRWIAYLFAAAMFYQMVSDPEAQKFSSQEILEGIGLIFAPLLLVICRWYLMLYLRRYHYRGWKDNDIAREVVEFWTWWRSSNGK